MMDAKYSGRYCSRSLNVEAHQNTICCLLKVGNLSLCCYVFVVFFTISCLCLASLTCLELE
jgi:hypothetical protein